MGRKREKKAGMKTMRKKVEKESKRRKKKKTWSARY